MTASVKRHSMIELCSSRAAHHIANVLVAPAPGWGADASILRDKTLTGHTQVRIRGALDSLVELCLACTATQR